MTIGRSRGGEGAGHVTHEDLEFAQVRLVGCVDGRWPRGGVVIEEARDGLRLLMID